MNDKKETVARPEKTGAVKTTKVQWDDSQMSTSYANVVNAVSSREEFTLEETLHIDMVYMGLLRTWESLYRAVQLGVLDEEMLTIIDSNVGPFRFAYFQESWSDFRTTFTEDFATFFENLMVG